MKKLSFLLVLPLLLLVFGCKNDKVDVTDTGFDYDVEVCNRYFKLVECIIDEDDNKKYSKEIRIELKNQIKEIQKEWKELNEDQLTKICTKKLTSYEKIKDKLVEIWCEKWILD